MPEAPVPFSPSVALPLRRQPRWDSETSTCRWRLARFEQCPAAFKYQYIDGVHTELTAVPLLFGKVVHATLERVFQDVIAEEISGSIDEARAKQIFANAWAESGLVGAEVYREGLEIVRNFVRSEGVIDHRDVLAVEKDFRLPLGRFSVIGCIDRVNRVDDETIEVVDYKTNRAIFTREEVDDSLQLSLYEVAARRIWPWAKKVRLSFAMLRHGLRMTTSRTPEQLEAALSYAETLGRPRRARCSRRASRPTAPTAITASAARRTRAPSRASARP